MWFYCYVFGGWGREGEEGEEVVRCGEVEVGLGF